MACCFYLEGMGIFEYANIWLVDMQISMSLMLHANQKNHEMSAVISPAEGSVEPVSYVWSGFLICLV